MPVAAGISAVGALGSAGIGAWSASNAADKQAQAAQQALGFQQQVYNQNQGNLKPWINTGQNANYTLAGLYGLPTPDNPSGGAAGVNAGWDAFTKLPAYTFPLQQGNLSLERQLNSQGRTQSGAQARQTQQFGQGLASQYMMSNYVNPLLQLSGSGQQAAGALAGYNNQSGQQIGQSYGNLGTAQGAGIMGMGNAISGGLNNASSSLALYSALGKGGNGNSSPTYGGGNAWSGDAWGGTAQNPLPGLSPSDYGAGF